MRKRKRTRPSAGAIVAMARGVQLARLAVVRVGCKRARISISNRSLEDAMPAMARAHADALPAVVAGSFNLTLRFLRSKVVLGRLICLEKPI